MNRLSSSDRARVIGWVEDGDNELIFQPMEENADGTDLVPTGERHTITLIDLEQVKVH